MSKPKGQKTAMGGYMAFDHDVKDGGYPQEQHGWHMDEGEFQKFQDMVDADVH